MLETGAVQPTDARWRWPIRNDLARLVRFTGYAALVLTMYPGSAGERDLAPRWRPVVHCIAQFSRSYWRHRSRCLRLRNPLLRFRGTTAEQHCRARSTHCCSTAPDRQPIRAGSRPSAYRAPRFSVVRAPRLREIVRSPKPCSRPPQHRLLAGADLLSTPAALYPHFILKDPVLSGW